MLLGALATPRARFATATARFPPPTFQTSMSGATSMLGQAIWLYGLLVWRGRLSGLKSAVHEGGETDTGQGMGMPSGG